MAEPKNPFDFGTGSIDKDQWLRDIDAEQGNFVSQYSSAVNKHRAALMREAFADLRRRIANGDMLNRTADGQYQFGSALSREDKHMQEAYQRALGFMGDLARRQIQAPPTAEPEKKKYSTKTLNDRFIRFFNPSGNQEAFTSLWNSYDDNTRKTKLQEFLRSELNTGLNNYQDVEDYDSMDNLRTRINNFISDPNITNLNSLGFNKNYLNQLTTTTEEEEEKPKNELEQQEEALAQQIDQFTRTQALEEKKQQLAWAQDALNYKGENFGLQGFIPYNFETATRGKTDDEINDYYAKSSTELDNYFKNLAVNWRNYLQGRQSIALNHNLSKLFSSFNNQGKTNYHFADLINKYFTPVQGGFLLNGTNEENGRNVYYVPGKGFTVTAHNRPWAGISSQKEGGILKYQVGGGLDAYKAYRQAQQASKQETEQQQVQQKTEQENSEEMDTGDWVTILGTTAADIGSMLSANAVGAGTAVSAGLGVASTLGNSVNDFRHGNVGSGLANLGIGLTTDLVGLIPGFGAGAKGYKIGRTLTRFARPLMAAFAANNFKEAGEVLGKGVRTGFGSLTAQDWTVLSTALTSMISRGKSAHTRQKNVEFMSKASQHSSPTDAKGNVTKHIINEEGFIKARKELLDQKRFGYNTSSKKYTKNVWNSIPEGGEIAAPFYAKPFEWPKFGLGKNKKQKQVEEFEDFLKRNKKPEASAQGSGPDTPVVVPNENANGFYPLIKNGAKLKALRNGGIIKAQEGLKTEGLTNKYDNISDWTKLNFGVTEKQYFPGFMKARYDNRGNVLYPHSSFAEQEEGEHFGDQSTLSAYDAQQAYYLKDKGSHIFGDVQNAYNTWKSKNNGTVQDFINYYNGEVDWLRSQGQKKLQSKANSGGWKKYNQTFNELYSNYSPYDSNLEDIIGESTWQRTPNTFKGITDLTDLRQGILGVGEGATQVAIDNQGHLITDNLINPKGDIKESGKEAEKEGSKATDSEGELKTVPETKYKNPNDPTPYIIAGKTAMGLLGNRNIYKNLLDEMPQAPLRDPIDRKLAIVGWQEAIKQGQNQLADLRNATWMQHGSDQQTNLAGMYETEGKGHDIMNDKFMKDSGRQFDTAQKSWNLDNEDTLYNIGVGDANRRAIADRARMMAQIRAAWRSGDNNILMGALSDTGNWLMKKYQREQDIVDKAKELSLGTPEEQAQAALSNDNEYSRIMNKHAAGQTLTDEEKAYVRRMQAEALKGIRGKFASSYYNIYHTPGFGGGPYTTIAKDGTKLEVAKLKARSKDNDRYVSMIKDLRTTRYRRRRR